MPNSPSDTMTSAIETPGTPPPSDEPSQPVEEDCDKPPFGRRGQPIQQVILRFVQMEKPPR